MKHRCRRDKSDLLHLYMTIGISVAVLFASLFVILTSTPDESVKKWAIGTVGLVCGFWLRR